MRAENRLDAYATAPSNAMPVSRRADSPSGSIVAVPFVTWRWSTENAQGRAVRIRRATANEMRQIPSVLALARIKRHAIDHEVADAHGTMDQLERLVVHRHRGNRHDRTGAVANHDVMERDVVEERSRKRADPDVART